MGIDGSARHPDAEEHHPYVVCASGNRSGAMTDLLRARGIDAVNVAGGTRAWVAAGLPVVEGTSAA